MVIRRAIKSGVVRAKRRMADLSPQEAVRARRDMDAAIEVVPELATLEQDMGPLIDRFTADHDHYCTHVGHPVHAASLELVAFLVALVDRLRPGRVIDLGSGFTSFALRQQAAEMGDAGAEIHSVDDSPEWLEKTRGYLQEKGVSTANLHTWQDLDREALDGSFDLVLHDMGFMDTRLRTLHEAIGLARPGAVVVLDDMHKPDYRRQALEQLDARGQHPYSMKLLTRDSLTRYAYLMVR